MELATTNPFESARKRSKSFTDVNVVITWASLERENLYQNSSFVASNIPETVEFARIGIAVERTSPSPGALI